MIIDLDPASLRAFIAVAEEGGFTRAARRLNRTQSAVSMQIRRLEDVLGAKLFADRKRARLSHAGERIIGHARRIVALNDEAVGRAQATDVAGRVRIGTPDDYAAFLLPPVLKRLSLTYPHIEVEVRCAQSFELIRAVDHGQLDLAIVTRLPSLEGGVTIRREPLIWAAASETVTEKRPLPMALFPPGCPFREAAEAALERARIPFRLAYESASLASLIPAVREGLAVTAVARTSVSDMADLVAVNGLPPLPFVEIAVYGAHGVLSAAAQMVNRLVVEALSGTLPERTAA